MSPTFAPAELFARVQRLLLTPAAEWDSIDGEGADVARIYQGYILPLMVAAAVAGFIGSCLIGINGYTVPIGTGLVGAIVNVAVGAGAVYVLGLVINALAPQFGAQQDAGQAFKVAAYSPTAAWIGGLFWIVPALWFVPLIGGFYTLYLLYIGLPKLMKPAADKALIYTLAVIGCMIVIGVVVGLIARAVMA